MPFKTWRERELSLEACVRALDRKPRPYTWGEEERALDSVHTKIAAHVAVLDARGLELLKREMQGKLGGVNRKPYNPPEDRAEAYANDFGDSLAVHYASVVRQCEAALQAIRAAKEPARFSFSELASARKAVADAAQKAKEAARAKRLAEARREQQAAALRQQQVADLRRRAQQAAS